MKGRRREEERWGENKQEGKERIIRELYREKG